MPDIEFKVYASYFVKVAPFGGPQDHVGEIDRIIIGEGGRVWVCCDYWFSTTTKNRIQGGCLNLKVVDLIDFDTFYQLIAHHMLSRVIRWGSREFTEHQKKLT